MIPWYGLIYIPALAVLLHGWWTKPRPFQAGAPLLNGILLGFLAVSLILAAPWWRPQLPFRYEHTAAAQRHHPCRGHGFSVPALSAGELLHSSEAGFLGETRLLSGEPSGPKGYQFQAFASYQIDGCPQLPVFIDTRFELYPMAQWKDYAAISNGRYDWQALMERYGMTYLFLSVKDQPSIVAAAQKRAGLAGDLPG